MANQDACILYLPFGDNWTKAFEIPASDITRMSIRSLNWLRFLGYIVLHSTGRLYADALSADLQEPEVDYNSNKLGHEYYYLPGWSSLAQSFGC
jgi:hypothetical protein